MNNLALHEKTQGEIQEVKIMGEETDNKVNQILHNQETHNLDESVRMQAVKNVNLRKRSTKNSGNLGLVTKGQVVTILEKEEEWMRVVFEDYLSDNPKTGWVKMEYFNSFE